MTEDTHDVPGTPVTPRPTERRRNLRKAVLLFILTLLLGVLALNAYYGGGRRRAPVVVLSPPDVSAFTATADAVAIERLYIFLFSPEQARESLLTFSETRLIDHQGVLPTFAQVGGPIWR